MTKTSIQMGKIFGIPIIFDFSWFIIFALLTWTLARGYYPNEFKDWPPTLYWIVGAVTAIMLFVSVLGHELGHSWVAQRYKIQVHSIQLFIFGGVSQTARDPDTAQSQFWINLAGPLVSLVLAGFFYLLTFLATGFAPLLALLKYLAYMNLILAAFNLIPGFPLDGGGVLASIIWGISRNKNLAVLVVASIGGFVAYIFLFLGGYLLINGNVINGLWIAVVGWFLLNTSGGQVKKQRLKGALAGRRVSEAMNNRGYMNIQAGASLQTLDEEPLYGGGRRIFMVKEDDRLVGMLTRHPLNATPPDLRPVTTAGQVMIPLDQLKQVQPDTGIWEAIQMMDQDGVNQLPVITGGEIQGMLTREDIISFLSRLQKENTA